MDMEGATSQEQHQFVIVTPSLTLQLELCTVALLATLPHSLLHLLLQLAVISPPIVPIVSQELLLKDSTVSGALLELEISLSISILVLVFPQILVL